MGNASKVGVTVVFSMFSIRSYRHATVAVFWPGYFGKTSRWNISDICSQKTLIFQTDNMHVSWVVTFLKHAEKRDTAPRVMYWPCLTVIVVGRLRYLDMLCYYIICVTGSVRVPDVLHYICCMYVLFNRLCEATYILFLYCSYKVNLQ